MSSSFGGILLLTGCGDPAIRVEVSGALRVPDHVDTLVFNFRGEGGAFEERVVMDATDRIDASLTVNEGELVRGAIDIDVRADKNGRTVAQDSARATFSSPAQVVVLALTALANRTDAGLSDAGMRDAGLRDAALLEAALLDVQQPTDAESRDAGADDGGAPFDAGRDGENNGIADRGPSADAGATADAGMTAQCIAIDMVPAEPCPAVCTGGCEDTTCTLDCREENCSGTEVLTCPDGYNYNIDCRDGCDELNAGDTVCPAQGTCAVRCSGTDCDGTQRVRCGNGPCSLDCNGDDDVRPLLDCGESCHCQYVDCPLD